MKRFLICGLVLMMFASCEFDSAREKIHGNGDVQQKEVSIEGFYQVESNGAFQVNFIQDTLWKIELVAESNILPLIDVYKAGSKLIIENKDGYDFDLNHDIIVTIHHSGVGDVALNGAGTLDLGDLEYDEVTTRLSGAGSITGSVIAPQVDFILSGAGSVSAKVDCNDLDASVSGQGNFNFEGMATHGIFTVSGVGNIQALNLVMDAAWCTISGVGDAYLKVSENLHATISGTGNIYYSGSPELDITISGAGKVSQIN